MSKKGGKNRLQGVEEERYTYLNSFLSAGAASRPQRIKKWGRRPRGRKGEKPHKEDKSPGKKGGKEKRTTIFLYALKTRIRYGRPGKPGRKGIHLSNASHETPHKGRMEKRRGGTECNFLNCGNFPGKRFERRIVKTTAWLNK